MFVRMLTLMSGPEHGTAAPGDVVDVPEDFAKKLLKGGFAEAVEAGPGPEPGTSTTTPENHGPAS